MSLYCQNGHKFMMHDLRIGRVINFHLFTLTRDRELEARRHKARNISFCYKQFQKPHCFCLVSMKLRLIVSSQDFRYV